MNSSGFKRGLAATAISAMAITGVPLLASSASANPLSSAVGASAVDLVTAEYTNVVSVRNDGTDTSIRLEAVGGTNVTQVTFSYVRNGTTTPIQTVTSRNDDGAFSYEWTPDASLTDAQITLQAVGLLNGGGNTAADSKAVTVRGGGDATNAVNLTSESAKGYFAQPYTANPPAGGNKTNVIVSGTASGGPVSLDVVGGNPAVAPYVNNPTTAPVSGGTFRGNVDITGYNFAGSPDELLVNALAGSDDNESYTLYEQSIGTVTAVGPTQPVPTGQSGTVTVTVNDQQGNPIYGAEVRSSNGNTLVGYTDARGQVTAQQPAGAGSTRYYYANQTDADEFAEAQGDKRSADITVGEFNQNAPDDLVGNSADGPAFDLDEFSNGDVSVQVVNANDQNTPVGPGQTIQYYWLVTPFDGSPAQERRPDTGTLSATVDGNGRANIPLPTVTDPSGRYELFAALTERSDNNQGGLASRKVLEFKAGQATITTNPSPNATAEPTTQVTVTGTLALEDGTPLAGRTVTGVYNRGNQGSDTTPDAGFLPADGSNVVVLNRTYTTGSNGQFTSTVDDAAETPAGTELGGNARYRVAGQGQGNIVPNTQVNVDFTSATPPAGASVTITPNAANTFVEPGNSSAVDTVSVTLPDGNDQGTDPDPVVGQQVTLTISQGYFTAANGSAVTGQPTTITVVTNNQGQATYRYSIGRNTGFDDDGRVTGTVVATAGSLTDLQDVQFSTRNADVGGPNVLGAVELTVADASEQDGPTDPAEVGQYVELEIVTRDGFGNEVDGQTVTLTSTDDDVDFEDNGVGGERTFQYTSDFDDNGDGEVTSTEDDDITVTARSANGQTDTLDLSFEESQLGEATIVSSPEGDVAPGTAVTETITVTEAEDDPFVGATVVFTVTAPDGTTQEFTRTTNSDGEASIVVTANQVGTYQVSALVTNGSDDLSASDSITVTEDQPEPPTARLDGASNGKKADRLTVSTENVDAGTQVKLYRFNNNGGQRLVDAGSVGADGSIRFTIRDLNGKKVTKYVAKVGAGDDALFTNSKRVR